MSRAPWFAALRRMDDARHRIPFWWWLTYDALVAVVIAVGVDPWSAAMWLGYTVLGIAVVIDTVEFLVKRPSARAALDAQPPLPVHELFDDDDLAVIAEDHHWVNNSHAALVEPEADGRLSLPCDGGRRETAVVPSESPSGSANAGATNTQKETT